LLLRVGITLYILKRGEIVKIKIEKIREKGYICDEYRYYNKGVCIKDISQYRIDNKHVKILRENLFHHELYLLN